jgi:hypothetical protein
MTGARSPGLAEILATEGGPSYRDLDYWVRKDYLQPEVAENDLRSTWRWTPEEAKVAIAMARLVAAGLRPEAAEKVARSPTWGPVVLGPGVVVSLFPLRGAGCLPGTGEVA